MGRDPDIRTMLRFQRGDETAFVELFRRHHRAMINYLYRYTGRRDRAEELVQECFLRIYRGRAGYTPTARWTTWAYRIATNLALNELRRREAHTVHVAVAGDGAAEEEGDWAAVVADPTPDRADDQLEGRELADRLQAALDRLPEPQRTAFLLCKVEGLSYRDIAQVLETSESAVKSLIFRARDALKREAAELLPPAYR